MPCDTSDGVAAFWGSDKNLDNIRSIEAGRVPFAVACDCISASWSSHDLWMPESSRIEVLALEESEDSEDDSVPATDQDSLPLHNETINAKFAESWMEAMELVDPRLRGLLNGLFRRRVPTPVVGFELARDTGAVLAESELAWPARKIAVVLSERPEWKASFEKADWRVFLHPTQRRLVERHWNGPVRVLGGAGTGKTVAAMHRARWLARNLPEGRILFTTFARNLATDIESNLRSICSPEEMNRIEVTNLDRWVVRFLRGKRYEFQVEFGRNREAWQQALDLKPPELDLSDSFYEDEWEQVIEAKGVVSEQEYRHVSRVGRGTRLGRGARVRVWPVFEEYRAQLAERGLKEVDDAYRDAAALLGEDGAGSGYAAVVVDEAQDMGAQAFSLIRAIAPTASNDLFIAGDGHQRIYGRNRVVMGRCGIDIRGRSRKLRLNYRTTEETRRWAANLLAGSDIDDLDGGSDDNKGIRSLTCGPEPVLERFDTREEQIEFLMRYLAALQTSARRCGPFVSLPARSESVTQSSNTCSRETSRSR